MEDRVIENAIVEKGWRVFIKEYGRIFPERNARRINPTTYHGT